jgi:hypothetical protein
VDEEVLSQVQQPPPISQEPELEVNDDELAEKLNSSQDIKEKQAKKQLVGDDGNEPAKEKLLPKEPANDPREEEKQPAQE